MGDYKLFPVGDSSIKIKFGDTICLETNKKIHFLADMVRTKRLEGIIEVVPSYHTLTIYYQPELTTYQDMHKAICRLIENELTLKQAYQSEIIEIPVLYGEKVGMDLRKVAEFNHLSEEEVIKIHSNATYFIYLIGFLPGFPYLGGISKRIATPRLQTPRRSVEQGSVGIAGEQTGIYPLESPGGWNIIGKTPIRLIRPNEQHPFPLKAGHYLRFKPISSKDFETIKRLELEGKFELTKEVCEDVFHD